jgi:hypothetical protein
MILSGGRYKGSTVKKVYFQSFLFVIFAILLFNFRRQFSKLIFRFNSLNRIYVRVVSMYSKVNLLCK